MNYFICRRSNTFCRAGQYLANEGDGEDFYLIELEQYDRRKWRAVIRSRLTLPFNGLAQFVVPVGFRIPLRVVRNDLPTEVTHMKEIESFQREVEDIYDEEKLRRDKAANPTLSGRKE